MFPHFKSLSDFLFVNEVISFFFRSYFDGVRSTARETCDPIDKTQQGPVARTQTQHHPHRCFSPALSAYLRQPMKFCSGPDVIVEPVTVAVAVIRQFCWWSVASTGLYWLLILYICMVCTGVLCSSSLAAILNDWQLSLCELRNLHELYCKINREAGYRGGVTV